MSDAQFDARYRIAPAHVENPGALKRRQFVIEQQRQLLGGLRRRPANIAWFEQRMEDPPDDPARPLVGTFCTMVPVEMILALGARPVQLGCGNPALVQTGEEVFAGEICPLVKSSFGAFLDGRSTANRCTLLILPTSCDAKKKLGEVLSDYRPTFMLNLPPELDYHRYGGAAADEMARLAAFLEKGLDARLSDRALRQAIALGRRRTEIVRRLQAVRAAKPAALCVRDLFLIVQSSFNGADLSEWLVEAQKALEEAERFEPARKRLRPRMVLTGAPMLFPNFKVLNLIEEAGADVVADTLCSGAQSCYDPVVVDEGGRRGLLRALASRYIFASACPCFISQGTRLTRVLDLVEEYRADGVINYGLRLCPLFDMEAYRLQRVLKERKVPFMNLRTDYSLEDTEQLRVRLEAFLETVGDGGGA